MKILYRNVRLVHANKVERGKKDIFVKDGKIVAIGTGLEKERGAEERDMDGAFCSIGWMDVGVQACSPGFEYRDTLQTTIEQARLGGFTSIAVFPNTNPPVHSHSEVNFIKTQASDAAVRVFPIGAVSEGITGENLAELYDMHRAGAVAFSDGNHSIHNAGLLQRALLYAQSFNGLIFDLPQDRTTSKEGQMHEGRMSTELGMRGIPSLSEVLAVQRDLEILRYTGGRLHLHCLSTAKGIDLVRKAKAEGLQVTCSVALVNLCFTDAELVDFDSRWKVSPPLRSEEDRVALLEAAKDGILDFICSNHIPWDEESKNLEFPYAEFGMLGLQTALPLALDYLQPHLSLNEIVNLWTVGPRGVLGLAAPKLEVGSEAELTFFREAPWTFSKAENASKSDNSPFFGKQFDWKVM